MLQVRGDVAGRPAPSPSHFRPGPLAAWDAVAQACGRERGHRAAAPRTPASEHLLITCSSNKHRRRRSPRGIVRMNSPSPSSQECPKKGRDSRGSGRAGGRTPSAPAERRAPAQPLGGEGEEDRPGGCPGPERGRRPFHSLPPETKANETQAESRLQRTGTPGVGEGRGSPTTPRFEVLSFHATTQGGPRRGPTGPLSRELGVWGDPSNCIRRASPREERAPRSAEARPEGLAGA